MGTVKSQLNDPVFQAENLPIRTIEVAVATDGSHDVQDIRATLAAVSDLFKAQVGIELKETSLHEIAVNTYQRPGILKDVYDQVHLGDRRYDLLIAFVGTPASDYILGAVSLVIPMPRWLALIDDSYRKVIISKTTDVNVLAHEVAHAFVFSRGHSGGLLRGMKFQLLPFTPAVNSTDYLTPGDRQEVLMNKGRSFRDMKVIHIPDGEDYFQEAL